MKYNNPFPLNLPPLYNNKLPRIFHRRNRTNESFATCEDQNKLFLFFLSSEMFSQAATLYQRINPEVTGEGSPIRNCVRIERTSIALRRRTFIFPRRGIPKAKRDVFRSLVSG